MPPTMNVEAAEKIAAALERTLGTDIRYIEHPELVESANVVDGLFAISRSVDRLALAVSHLASYPRRED